MDDMDEKKALRAFLGHMQVLIDDKVPFEKFVMKKNLSSKVVGRTDSIIQAKVNADRRARAAGSEASIGEQVEYVMCNGHKDEKATMLAQDPKFAQETGLKINRKWYFEHAIAEAVRKMLEPFPHLKLEKEYEKLRDVLDAKRLNVSNVKAFISEGNPSKPVAPVRTYQPRPPPPPKRKKRYQ